MNGRTVRVRRAALAFAIVLGLSCQARWKRMDGGRTPGPWGRYSAVFPEGWARVVAVPHAVHATADGQRIQFIETRAMYLRDAFPGIRDVDTDPSVLADRWLDALRSKAKNDPALDVLAIEPATVSGRAGFRLHVALESSRGVRYESVIYGLAFQPHQARPRFYVLTYRALARHYFERDLERFETVVQSFLLDDLASFTTGC